MNSSSAIFQNALLAQAAYGNFDIDNGSIFYADNSVKEAVRVEGDADFTDSQAANFSGPLGYSLVSFTSDPATGFEAALFESRTAPGKYTLAIRGTTGFKDIVGADFFGIAFQGQALAQSVSLYRYYKRLITPRGAAVEYSQAEIELLATVTNRKYDGYGIALLRNSRDFQTTVAGIELQLRNDTGLGRLDPSAIIDVTGHSLGGHLAELFGALFFPERVDHICTYNGAGLGSALYKAGKKVLAERGIDLAAKSTNIVAEEGLTFTAGIGYKFGPIQQLAIEQGIPTDNHSITNATDALALYALLGQISPDLSLDSFNKILRSAANEAKTGYEATLDMLRRVFLGPDIQPTQHSFRDDLAGRDAFYQNIDDLKSSTGFKAFVGESGRPYSVATLVGALNLVGLAQDDTDGNAYRYALKQLSPFALLGLDYAQYNLNGELDLFSSATGDGALTKEWLQDRAQFLTWKNQKNLKDIADGVSVSRTDGGAQSYLFADKTLKDSSGEDYSILVAGSSLSQRLDPIRISFAGGLGDTLQGGSYADHLYGGAGQDTLAGGGGDDYLEGGAGADTLRGDAGVDTLIGGSGADTLIGGADNDILQGGKGDDILQGGAGNDVYLIRAGDGLDTIYDHEGRNTIIYTDASGKRSTLGAPAFAVAGQSNTWTSYLAGGELVSFTRNPPLTATLPDGSQIVIDDYQDGDFGIQLRDLAQTEPQTTGLTLLGDLEPVHTSPIYDGQGQVVGWDYDEDELGNAITDPSTPAPDREDWLYGTDGNDFIAGFGGVDRIHGGDGADHIQGGTGADYLYGEDGDDVIEAQVDPLTNTDYDRVSGGAGDDRIFAATECSIDDALAHANDAGLESWGAYMMGEAGDDVIVGSPGLDRIAGGAGSDVLIGGGGDDLILGDADLIPAFNGGYGPDQGAAADDADVIYGGGGNDWIRAGLGDDYVDGGDGDDFIFGEGGTDILFGGDGDDNIFAYVNEANLITFDDGGDYIDGGAGNDWIAGSAGDNFLFGGDGDDGIDGGGGNDFIDGGAGNDRIQGREAHGGAGIDVVAGTAGADTLYGDDGDDVLAGWTYLWDEPNDISVSAGDDWLYGGAGNDTYLFRIGTGASHVVDDAGVTSIVLMSYEVDFPEAGTLNPYAPIARESIHVEMRGGSYVLMYGNAGDSIDLGALPGSSAPVVKLKHFGPVPEFDEYAYPGLVGPPPFSTSTPEELSWLDFHVAQTSTPEGGALIAAQGLSNTLVGKDGNDIIIGASREDVLFGGPGDDILDGGEGGDRYVFNPGDGVDIISDSGTQGDDTLAFGAGITADALSLGIGSLLIRVGDSGDAIHIDGFDADDAAAAVGIEHFEFADGTVLSLAQLLGRGFDLYGTEAADTIFGTNLVDRFHASAGDDTLIGGAGDDVYYFGAGSGRDFVIDQDTTPNNLDTVVLGNGIAPETLVVQTSPGVLTLSVAGTDDRLAILWERQSGYAIERVQFADGTLWDGAMLESLAVPAPLDDIGSAIVETDTGTTVESEPTPIAAAAVTPDESRSSSIGTLGIIAADDGEPDVVAATPPAVRPDASFDSNETLAMIGGAPVRDDPLRGGDSDLRNLPSGAMHNSQDALLALLSTPGAIEFALDEAMAPARTGAKPAEFGSMQVAGEENASTRDPAAFFTALQTSRPNLQTWLDSWLGPSARANSASPDEGSALSNDDDQSSSEQELTPSDTDSDLPQAQPETELTPEEIAQSYEEIRAWLDAHPGVGDGIAGAGGSPQEKNPFVFAGSAFANEGGSASMAAFGRSPGMAVIGGHALQPLRGINEGYLPLGLV